MMNTKPLLLIAEDDPDDQVLIEIALESSCPREVDVRFVWDGVELMDFLQQTADGKPKPKVLVLDLNMPIKDGREALREIKADPNLVDIPVVVLTTSINPSDVQYCQQYGIAGYYRKSGSLHDLHRLIEELCRDYIQSRRP